MAKLGRMIALIGRFPALLSFLLAQAFTLLVIMLLPHPFRAHTDIIGYPIHSHFNINRYYQIYFVELLSVPLIWWFLFNRFFKGWNFPQQSQDYPVKSATKASVIKFEFSKPFSNRLCTRFYWLSPLLFLILFYLSTTTSVTEPSGTLTRYPWFSLRTLLILIAIAYFLLWQNFKVNKSPPLLSYPYYLLVLPIIVFLFHSYLPSARTWIHLYHDGESLVPSLLWQQGYTPWKDFLFTHGLLQDPLLSRLGHHLFENSVWGSDAGIQTILIPLYAISWYGLYFYIFRKNHSFLYLFVFILPLLYPLYFDRFNLRFIFFPPLMILFLSYLERPHYGKGLAFGSLMALSLFLTPELLPLTACLFLFLFAQDIYYRKSLTKTPIVILGFLIIFSTIAAYLHSKQALIPFLRVYSDEGLDYRYESGLPMPFHLGNWFGIAVFIPWITYFGGMAYFYSLFRQRRLESIDWVMLSYHTFSILYFAKFLCRPDTHILAHTALALPLLGYFISNLPIAKSRLAGAMILLLSLFSSAQLKNKLHFPKYQIAVPKRSSWMRYGFRERNDAADEILGDLEPLFKKVLEPGDTLFDFTNEPALFHYLLGVKPSTHYPFVIVAATAKSQDQLIQDLVKSRSKLIVYGSQLDYASWDGVPGMVRHYKVSQYLLENYKPFVRFRHHTIFQRKDLDLKYVAPHLLPISNSYSTEACDWGYSPQFLKQEIPSQRQELKFHTTKVPSGYLTEVQISERLFHTSPKLEISFNNTNKDAFSLVDQFQNPGDLNGMILFKTWDQESNMAYVLPIASCPQWRTFRGNKLIISHRLPQNIKSISLLTSPNSLSGDQLAKNDSIQSH